MLTKKLMTLKIIPTILLSENAIQIEVILQFYVKYVLEYGCTEQI